MAVVLGYILFILPNVFFGVTKLNGGLTGINLLWVVLFLLVAILLLVRFALRPVGKDFRYNAAAILSVHRLSAGGEGAPPALTALW
ncbi:hypothetical protein BH20VER3_BH20VER3_22230 [soil metagenome]